MAVDRRETSAPERNSELHTLLQEGKNIFSQGSVGSPSASWLHLYASWQAGIEWQFYRGPVVPFVGVRPTNSGAAVRVRGAARKACSTKRYTPRMRGLRFAITPAARAVVLLALAVAAPQPTRGQSAARQAPAAARERHIVLAGAPNFRDLGGYQTTDGRHVRWGLIYRSGELSRLTATDYEKLATLNIAVVCDFRRDSERNAAPTAWSGSRPPTILNLPGDQAERGSASGAGADGSPSTLPALSPLLAASYPTYPKALASSFKTVLAQLKTQHGAVLYHCTAGKDRTGTFSALLLTMLGVPQAVVMEDYLLTNQFVATPARIDAMVARGASREAAIANIGVDRVYLESTLAAIDREYGSFDAYRRDALGVSDAELAALKAKLLE